MSVFRNLRYRLPRYHHQQLVSTRPTLLLALEFAVVVHRSLKLLRTRSCTDFQQGGRNSGKEKLDICGMERLKSSTSRRGAGIRRACGLKMVELGLEARVGSDQR